MNTEITIPDVLYGHEVTLDREIKELDKIDLIVTTLIHNHHDDSIPAVESFLRQKNNTNSIMLIVDDGTSKFTIDDERIYVARIPQCNVARARNFANEICRRIFSNEAWVCRLDSDDVFHEDFTLHNIFNELNGMEIQWALAGNDLTQSNRKLTRDNPVSPSFQRREYVLSRLKQMAEGNITSELPSCNLWKRNGFRVYHPEVGSAEDHWLVTKLLLRYQDVGHILIGYKHANYRLQGKNTQVNIDSGDYSKSRKQLYNAFNEDLSVGKCIDWGLEGIVFKHKDRVVKRFYSQSIHKDQIEWLRLLPDVPVLDVEWSMEGDRWTATSKLQSNFELESVSREMISRFIASCIQNRVVCLNVNKKNMFIDEKNSLSYIDVGTSIVPFEARFFRDMCLRLYLSFVLKFSDDEISRRSNTFRNNIDEMKIIDGFEDFYSREVQLYNLNCGFFRKPARDIKVEKISHDNTTLIIKACAMDYKLIRWQVQHIIRQITKYDKFARTVLLIDPKKNNFLRQHDQGDLEALLQQAELLKKETWIDEILVSPNNDHEAIRNCYEDWFNLNSISTHTNSGVPLFPQLWGFEQIETRYVLQMDCDVIFHSSVNDRTLMKMHEALDSRNTFSVGFNIPKKSDYGFTEYHGNFVPEVRCGLLDLERMMQQRPFPNTVVDDGLELSWYRSIERYQDTEEWKSLRGGFGSTYYIHPMNVVKQNLKFYDRCIDLVEQGRIPSNQREHWDIIEQESQWKYEERNEDIVFFTHTQEPVQHFLRGLAVSVANQVNADVGLIVFCDQTKSNKLDWLLELNDEIPRKLTIVRKRFSEFSAEEITNLTKEICTNNLTRIVEIRPKEILFDERVCRELIQLNPKEITLRAHLVHRPLGIDRKLSHYTPDMHNLPLTSDSQTTVGGVTSGFNIINYDRSMSEYPEDFRKTNYIPNINKLEIDITYFCNLTCSGCSRSSAQAPSDLHMPIRMIQDFLEDSTKRGKRWEAIHILGGEPTLHPDFVEIILMIETWLEEHSPETERKVISNGVSRKTMKNLSLIPEKWRYDNSFKHDREAATQHFEPFNYAPKDLEHWKSQDFTKGCYITQDSGIGLSPYGYHHCAIAGGIERIFNFGLGFDELPEHPWQFLDMMKTYCALCGHFLSDIPLERAQRSEMKVDPGIQSLSWEKGYKQWEENGDA